MESKLFFADNHPPLDTPDQRRRLLESIVVDNTEIYAQTSRATYQRIGITSRNRVTALAVKIDDSISTPGFVQSLSADLAGDAHLARLYDSRTEATAAIARHLPTVYDA